MGNWIDGKAIAQQIQADVLLEVQHLREGGVTPGLAVVLVGDHPASHVYVRSKIRTCRELGMFSEKVELPGVFQSTWNFQRCSTSVVPVQS